MARRETEGDVGALLRPAPEDVLRVWPVNKKVGNVKNDGPKLQGSRISNLLDLQFPLARLEADQLYAMA